MSEHIRRTGAQDVGSSSSETDLDQQHAGYEGQSYPNRPSVEDEYSRAATAREGTAARAQEEALEYADQAKDKAAEYGQKAQQQIDAGKDQAAAGMERAAGQLRERVSQSGGVQAQAGTKVADTMEQAAGYLREHSTAEMWDEVEMYVREHPAQALAGAAFAGFMLGRILR